MTSRESAPPVHAPPHSGGVGDPSSGGEEYPSFPRPQFARRQPSTAPIASGGGIIVGRHQPRLVGSSSRSRSNDSSETTYSPSGGGGIVAGRSSSAAAAGGALPGGVGGGGRIQVVWGGRDEWDQVVGGSAAVAAPWGMGGVVSRSRSGESGGEWEPPRPTRQPMVPPPGPPAPGVGGGGRGAAGHPYPYPNPQHYPV